MSRQQIDLGWCMARLDTDEDRLLIVSPAHAGEQVYAPAESVTVYGDHALKRLRDALNAAYPPDAP